MDVAVLQKLLEQQRRVLAITNTSCHSEKRKCMVAAAAALSVRRQSITTNATTDLANMKHLECTESLASDSTCKRRRLTDESGPKE